METLLNFCFEVMMLLQSEAMVAKKLLVDDKITASVKQNVSWVLYVRLQTLHLVKNFAFLKNICYQYLNFVLQVTFLSFYELLIG